MKFKFRNSKLFFSSSSSQISGFNIHLVFAEEIDGKYSEITANKANYLVDDLSSAGSVFVHNENILVSLGKANKFNLSSWLKTADSLAKYFIGKKIKGINISIDESISEKLGFDYNQTLEKFMVDFVNGLYYFDDFKAEKTELKLEKINILTDKKIDDVLTNVVSIVNGLFTVRDLANNPANVATPTYLADVAETFVEINDKVSAQILGKKDIQKLGMNSFLGVAKGSVEEPRFIILEYKGAKKSEKPVVLVGKGITFDSGGISIKPSLGMDEMKFDMCGAATVLGVFNAVARLNLPINLVVLVASCENMPSGSALKPGDVITSMSGKTIEILNTDAEGRLILCDALHYAKKYNPEWVIDIATLTGACLVALGNAASGIFSNDDELCNNIEKASNNTDDKVWRLPLFDEYRASIKGKYADLQNIGAPGLAGSSTAACFLEEFVDYKWAHIDNAGTAWSKAGGTGRPFKMVLELLRNHASQ
ncbi:MAG: leucyl aminopeptidase [Burkholderiales bacterium]|nr:leucyl aminopeptidase [Burkholderiales bacterium]